MRYQVVLDTNVILAALKSQRGASFRLLRRWIADGEFTLHLSHALALEYEEVLKRHVADLRDADDDMVLEVAVAGGCRFIVTFNRRDFAGVEGFGLEAITPGEFLRILDGKV